MTKEITIDGVLYKIHYRKELSQHNYTQRRVYDIETKESNYTKAHKNIAAIMADDSWTKGTYDRENTLKPSMANSLHPYHEFDYLEDENIFRYTLVIPYDD